MKKIYGKIFLRWEIREELVGFEDKFKNDFAIYIMADYQ